MNRYNRDICIVLPLVLGLVLLWGCRVQFVADYDAQTYEEILRVGKDVDRFYGNLLEDAGDSRQYDKYTEESKDI